MIESRLFVADCRAAMRALPAGCAQCVVTSPPYWSLRDYGLPPLTARQRAVFEFIRNRIERGLPPTLREIGREFGIRTTNGVVWHLKTLARKGYLIVDYNMARGIRLAPQQRKRRGIPLVALADLGRNGSGRKTR